jgi:AmiR/NasT family two-component response regulator/molybdopterin converting factor small subunit
LTGESATGRREMRSLIYEGRSRDRRSIVATVRIPTQLRTLTNGADQVTAAGETVAQLIADLDVRFPGIGGRLLDDGGALRRFVNVYVDDEDVRFLEGIDTKVGAHTRVSVIPAVAGGAVLRRVLVAEDEAIIRLDLKEMLEEEGLEVVAEASDGEAAVRLARDHHPDVVVMDVKMPGVDGISAARGIVEDDLGAVVMLTAYSQSDLVRRAAEAGAMSYLVKPFQKSDLLPAIEMAVTRHAEIRKLKRQRADLTERLRVRKVLDRAKGRLMDEFGLSEADAFGYLQKKAMEERRSLGAVASELLERQS